MELTNVALPCGHNNVEVRRNGALRCRSCKAQRKQDKKFFELVEKYMDGDESALELMQSHWQIP